MHRIVQILLSIVLLGTSALAQTTWTGATSTAWNVPGNWSAGVPNASTAAVIASAANQPTTVGIAGAVCADLTIQAGAALTTSNVFPLTVQGSIAAAGSATGVLRAAGTGTIATSGVGTLPTVQLFGGAYTITDASIGGDLVQIGSAAVVSIQTCRLGGNLELHGGGMLGLANSLLDIQGGVSLATAVPITTPPSQVLFRAVWNSDSNWQPTSGSVICTGLSTSVNPAPGTVFRNLEAESTFGTNWNSDLLVSGTLRMRSDIIVGGTTIDIGQRLSMTLDALLSGASVTVIRLHAGATSAGVINLPAATMDADGDLTFFLSAQLALNGGTHTFSNSLGMPGTLSTQPGASLVFDGSGVITVSQLSVLPNVTITGSYTIRDARIGGDLLYPAGAPTLAIQRCIVDGNCTFQGNAVIDSLGGFLDANGNVTWQTSSIVNTPPATIQCAGSWTSNGNFQPTSGLVQFDGIGPKSVTTPAFSWRNLRIAAPTQVAVALPVLTAGFLDVQGQLTTTGNDVEAFGALTVSGTLSAASSPRIRAHAGMTVSGSIVAGAAQLDVDGTASVSGSVSLGAGPHVVSGSVLVTGLVSMPAGQLLRCDASGTIDVVAGSPIPNVELVGANYNIESLVVSQDLVQTSGSAFVRTCVVQRDATFQGTGLGNLGTGLLNVRRDVVLQLGATVTAPPATIRCGRNFTASASFAPTSGLVDFDGIGNQAVATGPAPWANLRVSVASLSNLPQGLAASGNVTINGSLVVTGTFVQVGGALTVGASGNLSAAAATSMTLVGPANVFGTLGAPLATLAATDDLVVATSGALSLGAGPHNFSGGFDAQGALAVPGTADFHFNGEGSVAASPSNVLPTVLFTGGPYKVLGLIVQGLIRQTGGRLLVTDMTGLGDALFQGATVEGGLGDILDVAGNITFATTNVIVSPPALIRCGGAWSSNPQFLPTGGTVEMLGTGPQTMTSAQLVVSSLSVGAASQVSFSSADVILQNDLVVNGQITAPSNLLEVRRDLTVHAGGSMALVPSSVATVTGSVSNLGQISGGGTLRLVGTGTVSGGGAFGNLQVQTPGTAQVLGTINVGGALRLDQGTLAVPAGATILAAADFVGTGGTLRGAAGGLVDVVDNCLLAGVIASPLGMPDIRCGGDWSADNAFAPTSGNVRLTGVGTIESSGGSLTFAHLELFSGVRTLTGNLVAAAIDVQVQAAALLDIGLNTMALNASSFTVAGEQRIGAGGALLLGPGAAMTVPAGGKLTMVGTVPQPARIDGPVGGDYSLVVDGAIEAVNFAFAHMGAAGIRINAGATIAAAPRDLRGGRFSSGSSVPGSCLLHLDRSAPAQLRYATFDDAGTVTFNVRSTGTAQVSIVNDEGTFTGAAHEDDAGSRIDWLPPEHTQVTRFTSRAAVHRTELLTVTTAEFDVLRFHLLRSTALAGPYADLAASPFLPTGSPVLGATYAGTDFATVDTTRYFYRLEEELTHGARRVLGNDTARPWPQSINNVFFVGTNGGYPDIAAAVAAAPVGGNIAVQAGTYPAFTLTKAVRIGPDGSGPVLIDTTFAKMVVRDIPANSPGLDLFDLIVGTPASPFGMEIVNCDNTIVLDGLQVQTTTGVTGLLIDDTAHLAVQSCTFSGDPGVRVDNASLCYVSRGTIDELVLDGSSTVTRCGVTPASETVNLGSNVVVNPGVMPDVRLPMTWPTGKNATLDFTTSPNSNFALFYSFGRDFFELAEVFPFIDMVLLIEQTQAQILFTGFAAAGTSSVTFESPNDPAFWGLAATVQVFELRSNGLGRMSNSRSVLIVP